MKIVIISRVIPYIGGREVIIEYLIENFKKNHSILLLTPDINIKRRGIKTVDINQNNEKLEKILRKFQPDLINCHTFYFFDLANNFSKTLNVPLVSTFHGMFLKFYGKDYTSIIGRICHESDAVTVVSRSYKKELISHFNNINGKNIYVIRNGIPRSLLDKNKLGLFKLKLDIPQGKKLVVVPARINKVKGLKYLIGAVKKMKKDIFFFLVCSPLGRHDKREDEFKKKLFKSFDFSNMPIRFRKFSHSDMQKIFNISDVCLLPSLIEGISISILEAMGRNCFVIATNVGGSSEIIKNNKNGYLIRPRNVKDILGALIKFNRLSLEEIKKIKNNAKKTVHTRFSEKEMIKLYQNLFSNIIKKYENKQ